MAKDMDPDVEKILRDDFYSVLDSSVRRDICGSDECLAVARSVDIELIIRFLRSVCTGDL